MKLIRRSLVLAIIFITSVMSAGCNGITGFASFKPHGIPLKITVDTEGRISFSASQSVEIPTPLGILEVGISADPAKMFGVQSTLTVRVDEKDHIYNLHGQDFDLQFEEGYYRKISLIKAGKNLLLELVKVNPDIPQTTDTTDLPITISSDTITSVFAQPVQPQFNTRDGVEMVLIPAGEFIMGSLSNDPYTRNDSKPKHNVYLEVFRVDVTEVTNAMYEQCIRARVCTLPAERSSYTHPNYYENPEYANYPVIWIDWEQAYNYCKWRGGRLPTEAEWEKAARGDRDDRQYPCGDDINCTQANYSGCVGDTVAVNSYLEGASQYGVLNMAGNVWEWVMDWYLDDYYSNSPLMNPSGPLEGIYRVVRGGSWDYGMNALRVTYRVKVLPNSTNFNIGFRCVFEP